MHETHRTTPEEAIARNVRRLRMKQGLGKARFCLMTGIGRPTLDQIEEGAPNAKLSTIRKVAESLGVEVADLLEELP